MPRPPPSTSAPSPGGNDEKRAMLANKRPQQNGAIDIPDNPANKAWISSKFTLVYVLLFLIFILVLILLGATIYTAISLYDVQKDFNRLQSGGALGGLGNNSDVGENADASPRYLWHNQKCDGKCTRNDYSKPPLIVISLDGFGANYLERKKVKSLDHMAACGSRAEFMYPSYPSRTFPNHYTMATGLYPESHGLVDNNVYDPSLGPKLVSTKKDTIPGLYKGLPIWSAYKKHANGKTACLFWVGCFQAGIEPLPDISMPYDKNFDFYKRVEKVVEWVKEPEATRPGLIMAYFDQPDTVGHFQNTTEEVDKELEEMDKVLDRLFTRLADEGILDCVNLLIVSDHGMQLLNKTIFFDEHVNIDGMIAANGVVGRLHLGKSKLTEVEVAQRFGCSRDYRVFNRPSMPIRYHYAATDRVGDLVFDGRPGTNFFPDQKSLFVLKADHGYDYLEETMHAIFFARGPSIKKGVVTKPFQNVELFQLFEDLLKIPVRTPTNGTSGLMDQVLVDEAVRTREARVQPPLRSCPSDGKKELRVCGSCDDSVASLLQARLGSCPEAAKFFAPVASASHCVKELCDVSILLSPSSSTLIVETVSSLSDAQIRNSSCSFLDEPTKTCPLENSRISLFANGADVLSLSSDGMIPLNREFLDGPWKHLRELTDEYASRFGRLFVISGTIYDFDTNGHADANNNIIPPAPSHVFRVFLRCGWSGWRRDAVACRKEEDIDARAFVLPHVDADWNCLNASDYLLQHSARLRDVELLTGVQLLPSLSDSFGIRFKSKIDATLW